jgi:hypothetical protein
MPNIIPASQLNQYAVNVSGTVEALGWSLYDSATYALAGTTSQYTFFQVPVGQSSKTLADTNMTNAGQLPSPQKFLLESIEIRMYPAGAVSTTAAAAAALPNVNDINILGKAGWLGLTIMSKTYLAEGPLDRFPPRQGLAVGAAVAGTYAAGTFMAVDYARTVGQPHILKSPLLIEYSQNFAVTLNFPSTTATTANVKLFIHLNGTLYRPAQ